MATKMLGLEVFTDDKKYVRGEMIKVLMNVNPSKTVDVPEIRFKVECIRRNEYRDSRGRRRYEQDTMARSEVFMEGMTLQAGQPRTIEGTIAVPTDGVPTNLHGTLTTRWYLTTVFCLPTFPAEKKFEIQIVDQAHKRAGQRSTPGRKLVSSNAGDPEKGQFKLCMSCGTKNEVAVRFCNNCGDELG